MRVALDKKTPTKPSVVAADPVLYRKGLITLRDLKNKTIELSWRLSKADKKQAVVLAAIEKRLRLITLDEFLADLTCEKLDNKTLLFVWPLVGAGAATMRHQLGRI